MPCVRPAVQEDIVRIYRNQFFDRMASWEERREQQNRTEVSEPEMVAIQRLLAWAKDDDIEIDIRVNVLEALEVACDYAIARDIRRIRFSPWLFLLSLALRNGPPDPRPKILLPNQPQNAQLERLDEFRRTQQWNFFTQRLQTCLKKDMQGEAFRGFRFSLRLFEQSIRRP